MVAIYYYSQTRAIVLNKPKINMGQAEPKSLVCKVGPTVSGPVHNNICIIILKIKIIILCHVF